MSFITYILCGLLGGVLGGMGLGGGTVLIPLLTILVGVSQHSAQGANLLSFIPMSIIALVIHVKNKLIDYKWLLYMILPGVATCIIGCYLAKAMNADLLKRCFGGFLVLLSITQLLYQSANKREK